MANDNVRVLRILEYTGRRDRVEETVARSIHGAKDVGNGLVIRGATIGDYPEILGEYADANTSKHVAYCIQRQGEEFFEAGPFPTLDEARTFVPGPGRSVYIVGVTTEDGEPDACLFYWSFALTDWVPIQQPG